VRWWFRTLPPMVDGSTRADAFRALHHADEPLVLPNAWDFASAAALARAGFPAVGTTSLGVAAAGGKPDATGATRDETLTLADRISALPCLVTIDVEGGFSDRAEEVVDLAAKLSAAGAVGVNIEDGRADGSLRPVELHGELIAAIKERVPELFVNARTDTYWLGGEQAATAPTVDRAMAYVRAGADGIFVPGVVDGPAIEALVGQIPAPVNILFIPGSHERTQLAALGVQRISTGSLLFRVALGSALAAASAVAKGRPVSTDAIPSYHDIQALVSS
jgi:2-methylisocitrate lyase-like PEP mutase family enzyme